MRFNNIAIITSAVGISLLSGTTPAFSTDQTVSGKMSTATTQDIINTLRVKGKFHKMLGGLESAFALDNTLKGKGPFTVFACDDKGWGKINQADQDTLFNNKNKLSQVFTYQVIKDARLDSRALKSMTSIKSMEGHEIKLSIRKNKTTGKDELYADNARVKTVDIHCSNGIIHITDQPIMPKLAE